MDQAYPITKLSDRLNTPVRPTVPNVGRNAVTPHRDARDNVDEIRAKEVATLATW
ncbi:hypothetical protein COLO4_37282 [Corchorus olitorius]|uniref:Uncharacterized protein n=1 Tax=Corchorus olitorius TaxID=93759 RepID=A0A1R3G2R7_9ROSI|nr:hypothetical protein COLO4_37282 [Corchorus olitorius]